MQDGWGVSWWKTIWYLSWVCPLWILFWVLLTIESLVRSASTMLLHSVLRILLLKLQMSFFFFLYGIWIFLLDTASPVQRRKYRLWNNANVGKSKYTRTTVLILSAECTHCFVDQMIHSFADISVAFCVLIYVLKA